jgi:glycosyltransferase involved in cell wall biosynthesis
MTLKIGWVSNAPFVGSGYGMATAEITRKLRDAGHDVSILANHGLAGSTIQWEGMSILPQGIDGYSNDLHPAALLNLAQGAEDRFLGITLFDVWVFKNPQWDQSPLLSWTPVDHDPVPDEVMEFFNRPGRKWAMAMSRFGEAKLLEAGVPRDRLFYSPHTFNPKTFTPEGPTMRETLQVPKDAHLSMINAANKGNTPIRKAWFEQLYAWARFAEKHDDAYLYIHSEMSGIANGCRLDRLLQRVKAPMNRIRVVPQYEYRMGIDHSVVANLHRSSDVLLHATLGEGFGVSQIESMAVGVPIIATNNTSMTELNGAGWLVEGQIAYDEFQGGALWKVPSIDGIIDALEKSYAVSKNPADKAALSAKAIAFAADYSTDKVFAKYWVPTLAQLEQELKKPRLGAGINREQRRAAVRGKK